MRRARAALLALVLALAVSPGGLVTAHAAGRPMYFEHIAMRDGLSQNTVMTVLQDRQGFIWLGTEGGLDRWDGLAIKRYQRGRGGRELASDFVWALAEDAAGDLWVATDGGGLSRWNRASDSFDTWRHDPAVPTSLASDRVRSLLVREDGRIWVGTMNGGLDLFDPRSGTFAHHGALEHGTGGAVAGAAARAPPRGSVYALHQGRDRALWIGTDTGLVRRDAAGALRRWRHRADDPRSLCGDAVRSVLSRADGSLWVGTFDAGVCRLDPRNGGFTHFRHADAPAPATAAGHISNNDVRALYEDGDRRLWVGTANGLNLYDPTRGMFVATHADGTADGLADSYVMSLYQDRGGVLWIGTRSAGVSTWNPRSWALGHFRPGWSVGTNITSFADTKDSTWIGTMGRGLVREFHDVRRTAEQYLGTSREAPDASARSAGMAATAQGSPPELRHVLPDERVMSLLAAPDGSLWVGTMAGGLLHLWPDQPARREHFMHRPGDATSLGADGVMAMHLDRRGNLWVGTYGGGVSVRRRGAAGFSQLPTGKDGLTSLNATAIVEDAAGAIWIGTDAGLNLVDPVTGSLRRFHHEDDDPRSLAADSIYSLHVDDRGTLWVGTAGGGLSRMRGSSRQPSTISFATIAQANGLSSNVVYGIRSDDTGKLWLSGNNGLSRHDPATGQVQTYHRNHGLQGEEFNFGAYHRSADGCIWFGGANGYNAFMPSQLRPARVPPPVVLTRFETLGGLAATQVPHHLLRTARLTWRESMFAFEFAALDFVAPSKNRYRYMLEGFDAGWIDARDGRRATYTNLDPGSYRFRVHAANSEGVWNHGGLAVDVIVDPPPWRTPLAFSLYAALAVLAGTLAFRSIRAQRRAKASYLARLERAVHARTLELEERSDELRQLASAKGDFVARMSHELRTPMNGVLGMSELLLQTGLDVRQARLAATIRRSASSLLGIINDILDFSKVEASRLQLEQLPIDLEQLADESVEALAVIAQGKGLEIFCEVPSEDMPALLGDPLRIRQILSNLLGNAIKFTSAGEVVLGLRMAPAADGRCTVRVEVTDTGAGIRADRLPFIFESFAQEDASTSRRFGGTGLGLPIARQLAQLMGADIAVESEVGRGSRFHLALDMPMAAVRAVDSVPARGFDGRRAQLVGADSRLRKLVERYLRDWGMHVCTAVNAQQAREQSDAEPVDVVVLLVTPLLEEVLFAELAATARHGAIVLSALVSDAPASPSSSPSGGEQSDVRASRLFRPVPRRALRAALHARMGGAPLPGDRVELESQQFSGRVLVAEDNEVNQEVITAMLAQHGITAQVVGDAEAALDLITAEAFDLVLMDCNLPGMSGHAATAAIRALPGDAARTTIVAFTANASATERQRCLDAGMDDVLMKPCEPAILRALLARRLPGRAGLAVRAGTTTAPLPMRAQAPAKGAAVALASRSPDEAAEDPASLHRPTIDRIRALRPRGDADMLTYIVRVYRDSSPPLISDMEAAHAAGDALAFARAAHAFKSSSENVGAHGLAALCKACECAGREGRLGDIAPTLRALAELYPRVVDALERERRVDAGRVSA